MKGKYQIHVNHYSNKGGKDPTYFQVLVRIEGQKPMKFKGAISAGEPKKEIYATPALSKTKPPFFRNGINLTKY